MVSFWYSLYIGKISFFCFYFLLSFSLMFTAGYSNFSVSEKGEIKAWGLNDRGQLGTGDKTKRTSPTVITTGMKSPVFMTGFGGNLGTSFALDIDGTLWKCGEWPTPSLTFVLLVGFPKGISHLSKLDNYSTCLAATAHDGTVWVHGISNKNSECGLGTIETPKIPTQIQGIPPMRRTASGSGFLIMEDMNGNLYSCGFNGYGQLGFTSKANRKVPTRIQRPEEMAMGPLISIHAGNKHTVVLDSLGVVWECGTISGYRKTFKRLTKVSGIPPLVSLDVGYMHTLGLDQYRKVWGWGCNGADQLFPSKGIVTCAPREVATSVKDIVRVYCGCSTSFVETSSGELWGFGWGGQGSIGIKSNSTVRVPTLIPQLKLSHQKSTAEKWIELANILDSGGFPELSMSLPTSENPKKDLLTGKIPFRQWNKKSKGNREDKTNLKSVLDTQRESYPSLLQKSTDSTKVIEGIWKTLEDVVRTLEEAKRVAALDKSVAEEALKSIESLERELEFRQTRILEPIAEAEEELLSPFLNKVHLRRVKDFTGEDTELFLAICGLSHLRDIFVDSGLPLSDFEFLTFPILAGIGVSKTSDRLKVMARSQSLLNGTFMNDDHNKTCPVCNIQTPQGTLKLLKEWEIQLDSTVILQHQLLPIDIIHDLSLQVNLFPPPDGPAESVSLLKKVRLLQKRHTAPAHVMRSLNVNLV